VENKEWDHFIKNFSDKMEGKPMKQVSTRIRTDIDSEAALKEINPPVYIQADLSPGSIHYVTPEKKKPVKKPYPALCLECVWSKPEDRSSFMRCYHPNVVGNDPFALAHQFKGKSYGVSCTDERSKLSWFAPCGIRGRKWEGR
jgi:hypothetical protein